MCAAAAVGYGDIVATPFNDVEQVVASCIMLFSGMIWGFLIGTFCNLASNLSPSVQLFRAELSQLNYFMSHENVRGCVMTARSVDPWLPLPLPPYLCR